MVGRPIARRSRAAGVDRPAPDRRGRSANSIDRYSLALQLIQVFPILTGGTALLVTTTWLARALAGLGLLAGTVWAVRLERAGAPGPLRRRAPAVPQVPVEAVVTARLDETPDPADAADQIVRLVGQEVSHGPDGVVLTRVTSEYGEINISIRLQPPPTVYRRRARRRRLANRHNRPPRGTDAPGE